MRDPDELIRGERVALRPARVGDRERWFEMLDDPLQRAFGVPAFVGRPQVEDFDDRVRTSRERYADGAPGDLVVVDAAEPDRLLGDVSWRYDVPPPMRVADVGYVVHPGARGRGIATAALVLLVRWLTVDDEGPGLARVQLDHSLENPASCHVALAAGLAREGVRRGFLPLRDQGADADDPGGVRRHDVCLHGVVTEG